MNDNAPWFPAAHIRINMSEGSLPGSSISLRPAQDIDSPGNGIISYRLVDETLTAGACSDNAPFELRVERDTDGSHDVRLVLQSPGLDREVCDQFRLTVIARDAGSPPGSASLVVDVVVTDINDNRPVFQRSIYDTEISENVDPATYGSALVTVKATDADHDANGLVRYRLSTRSNTQFGHLFGVDAATGTVKLLQAVDYERLPRGGVVVLEVLAQDQTDASDSVMSSTMATVRVRVRDVNDNAPTVIVESQSGDQDIIHVVENCANGTLIAHVTVSDADTGDGGRVDCRLLHHNQVRRSLHVAGHAVCRLSHTSVKPCFSGMRSSHSVREGQRWTF